MAEQEYFKKALADFMFDAASGGAIRHLADRGYTATEILKKLDFPTPYDRIQNTIWQHFLDTGVLLLEEPGQGRTRETYAYVTDYDQYGRKSFRRVITEVREEESVVWQEHVFQEETDGGLLAFLTERCAAGQEAASYISCDFGLRSYREPERYQKDLQVLSVRQQQYITGIPWERRLVYHRLNQCMREIAAVLYEHGAYHGSCYFAGRKEKIIIRLRFRERRNL